MPNQSLVPGFSRDREARATGVRTNMGMTYKHYPVNGPQSYKPNDIHNTSVTRMYGVGVRPFYGKY